MTRAPSEPGQRRAPRPRKARDRGAQLERDLGKVLQQLAAGLQKTPSPGLAILLERALRDAVRASRGAADARDGESPRWAALFNRLLAGAGERLAAALRRHPDVRHRDAEAAASVVVHAIEGLVRRSAELPNARARSEARVAAVNMLKMFLTSTG
jgi:hypothetical protein